MRIVQRVLDEKAHPEHGFAYSFNDLPPDGENALHVQYEGFVLFSPLFQEVYEPGRVKNSGSIVPVFRPRLYEIAPGFRDRFVYLFRRRMRAGDICFYARDKCGFSLDEFSYDVFRTLDIIFHFNNDFIRMDCIILNCNLIKCNMPMFVDTHLSKMKLGE